MITLFLFCALWSVRKVMSNVAKPVELPNEIQELPPRDSVYDPEEIEPAPVSLPTENKMDHVNFGSDPVYQSSMQLKSLLRQIAQTNQSNSNR